MLKRKHISLKRKDISIKKTVEVLQHEIASLSVTLVLPRRVRLRLRGDEPEQFLSAPRALQIESRREKVAMKTCEDWVFLDRLL